MTICPRCNGKGKVREDIDWLSAVFTVGMTLLADISTYNKCNMCLGRGYLDC